ncbi:MAG: hypothetical protein N3F04_01110 [Candidatus Nezhaarchaeota archaeon]|nr:hypothetical protein [Candidatus Nezhaarchaeota archaeon]MCX8141376.1 hypothetical protein [Candidatus Nezhaarchaeota archaeon]MDW8049642.1 hypothetical protein [Nitrososphaerota archaeon]
MSEKVEREDLRQEEIVEDLWRDLYESRCKLMRSSKPPSLEEVLLTREG